MLSISSNPSSRQFDFMFDGKFDGDAFARSKGFKDMRHFNATADLISAVYELAQLEKEIETRKERIAFLEAQMGVKS